MKERLYKVTIKCKMDHSGMDKDPSVWKEYYWVTAANKERAIEKASTEAFRENCWDEWDVRSFSIVNIEEPIEIKGKDIIGCNVAVNPKFFNERASYVIEDYGHGNYCVVSRMWLQKSDFELVPICKYGEKVKP
jgi:hypothetical protein